MNPAAIGGEWMAASLFSTTLVNAILSELSNAMLVVRQARWFGSPLDIMDDLEC